MRARCPRRITQRWPLSCIARAESASPASGSHASHNLEQELLIERAFTIGSDPVG
jgi:2-oxoglutarate dehydrogenase E1 component